MIQALAPMAAVFALNSRLLENCLDGVTEAEAQGRPNDRSNSVAFIAAHLVNTRAWMIRYLGGDEPEPFGGALAYGTAIDSAARVPSLDETLDAWDEISERLETRLATCTAAQLAAPSPEQFPGVPPSVLDGLGFLLQHESYHLGQLGLLRKFLGHPAMSYRMHE